MQYRGYAITDCGELGVLISHWTEPDEIVDYADTLQEAKDKVDTWLNAP